MGYADRLSMDVGSDYVTVSGNGYLQPITIPRAVYDQEVARINQGAQKTIDDFTDILTNPAKKELLDIIGRSNVESQIAQGQSKLVDTNNLDEGTRVMLANNILSNEGLMSQVDSARDDYVNSQKSQAFSKFSKIAGPLALAAGGYLLAPALFGGGAAAAGGAAGAGGTAAGTVSGSGLSSSLLSAQAGLGAGAGYSATLGGTGLGALLGAFSLDAAKAGALKGGVGGYMSGGDLSSALKGAALGGATGGYGEAVGSAAGLNGAGLEAFKGGLTGASGSLANGDIRGAAIGGAVGAGTGYYQGGGFGNTAGTSLDQASGVAGAQGPTQGTGLAGAVTRTTNPITNSISNFTGGGGSSFQGGNMNNLGQALKIGGSIYGDYTNRQTNKDIERRLLDANSQAVDQMQPYQQAGLSAQQQLSQALAAGFSPADLENDPGYQFQLEQGEKAVGRGMSAQGMTQSGAALKALQDYGQGLASTRYNDAYNQWLQQNQQLQGVANTGYGAAQNVGNIYSQNGQIQGSRLNANQDSRNELIAALTGMFA